MTDPHIRQYKLGEGSQIVEDIPCCKGSALTVTDNDGVVMHQETRHHVDCAYEHELRKKMFATAPEPITMQEQVPIRSCHCHCGAVIRTTGKCDCGHRYEIHN